MSSTIPDWRNRWPVAYGAVELKRSYRRNFIRGFSVSVVLNLLAVGIYWLYAWRFDEPVPARTMRILAYDEFVVPAATTQPLGLGAHPVLPLSDDNAYDPAKNIPDPQPQGTQTRRFTLPPRDFSGSLGDLPSAFPGDEDDPRGEADHKSQEPRFGPEGGSNNQPLNSTPGGSVSPGRDGSVPSGGSHSGIGSGSKPAPGGSPPVGEPFGTIDGTGGGKGFSVEWLQGGTRKKSSGDLPVYPPGAHSEADLVFYAVVDPEGSIRTVTPAQKGDVKLEREVLEKLRFWKFEQLPLSYPQVDQTCILTFQFRLK